MNLKSGFSTSVPRVRVLVVGFVMDKEDVDGGDD